MILSDALTSPSGLGRIARDLATRIHANLPEFRVASIGYGGTGSRHFPFPQYHIHSIHNWIVNELPGAWYDFAGAERGILLVIWDASRLDWMFNPPPSVTFPDFLAAPPYDLWTYTPLDAEGPHG